MNNILDTDYERLARAEMGGNSGSETAPAGTPDAQIVADFERALQGAVCPFSGAEAGQGMADCGAAPSGRDVSGKAQTEDEKCRENAVGAMLAHHGAVCVSGTHVTPNAVSASSVEREQAASAVFTEKMEGLVKRILVSAPENGKSEIIVSLDDSLLPGTEIHMSSDAGGMLHVRLDASNPAVLRTLSEARDDLRKRLEKYGRGVRVSVSGLDSSNGKGETD